MYFFTKDYHLDITSKFFSNIEVLSNPSVSHSVQLQEKERLFNYYIQHLIRIYIRDKCDINLVIF